MTRQQPQNPYGQTGQPSPSHQPNPYPPNQANQPSQPSQYGGPSYQGNPPQQSHPYPQYTNSTNPRQNPYPQQQYPYAQQSNPYAQSGARPNNPPASHVPANPRPAPSQYYYTQPVRKKRGLSGGGIAAIVISVVLIPILLFIAVTAGFAAMANKAFNDAAQQAQSQAEQQQQTQPKVTYITMKDRPSYQETYQYVNGKYEQYSQEALTDLQGFMDKYRIPITDDGGKYVTDFIAVLGKYSNNLKLIGDTIGVDADEMDDIIASYKTDTDTVEAHFKKGEPLEVQITLKGTNGDTYTVDGQNSVELKPLWADLEPKIASAANNMGSNYAESAQKIVELAGLQVNWDFNAGKQYCTKSSSNNPDMQALEDKETFAYYCPVTPNVIYANANASGWDTDYAPAAAIRHELAHHAIHMYCGTIQPPVVVQNGVNRFEGVTSSYAIKYLGADAKWLKQSAQYAAQNHHEQYLMDDFTDKAAEAIHRGECEAIQ
ncbi:hypothetical protein BSD967_00645 [Bifidobacterium saguini]|uniref:Uncharacterized protein n=1 Tax=Bifidobacterium saguini TaxID=762210 RepID=A0ABX7SDM1_9BIFI|nr:proline-rich domain-containing protein [Bifidobacterium saguini]QTB90993.1 hypothetical protein BSD967_00645 [Bifidobacterium saguini]